MRRWGLGEMVSVADICFTFWPSIRSPVFWKLPSRGNQLFFSLSLTYSAEVVSISQIGGEAYDLGLTNQDVPSPLACVNGGTHDPS